MDNETRSAAGHAETAEVKFDAIDAIVCGLGVLNYPLPANRVADRAVAGVIKETLEQSGFVIVNEDDEAVTCTKCGKPICGEMILVGNAVGFVGPSGAFHPECRPYPPVKDRTAEECCVAGHLFRDGVDMGEHEACCGIGCTEPNESIGETRSISELYAQPGESILRKSATWKPENDTDDMTVPEMVLHIYSNRKSKAVAPNGWTCPFITTEEHTRLAEFMRAYLATQVVGEVDTPCENPDAPGGQCHFNAVGLEPDRCLYCGKITG